MERAVAIYKVTYNGSSGRTNEMLEASRIYESSDGRWLIFEDDLGEVRRHRADLVYRVSRESK
jgi:hypothetical protein